MRSILRVESEAFDHPSMINRVLRSRLPLESSLRGGAQRRTEPGLSEAEGRQSTRYTKRLASLSEKTERLTELGINRLNDPPTLR
jgi:hypothetical protein